VLVSADEIRLTGLGIARAIERIGVPTQVRRPYTAPERTTGSIWDRRADVFGLAAMIHEMLWGRRVAGPGDEAAGSLTEIAGGDLPRLRAVFGRALAADPAARFDTGLEFASALMTAFGRLSAVGTQKSAVSRRQSAAGSQPSAADGRHLPTLRPPAAGHRSPAEPATGDRRLPIDAPRLPLEPAAGETPPFSLNLREPEPGRFAEIDVVAAKSVVPATVIAEAPPVLPPALAESYRPAPDGMRPDERSPSAILPLGFALLIGAALGFAAGFGVGTSGRSPGAGEDAAASAAREFSEGAVDAEVQLKPVTPPATPTMAAGLAADTGTAGTKPPAPVAAPPIVGSLLVRSTPPGARVLVDGRDRGRTPVTVGNLSRGAHSVRVIRDGYEPDEREVTVTSVQRAHSMTVRLSPRRVEAASAVSRPAAPSSAPLTVESRPAGAAVFLDGRLVGTTPLVVPAVAAGEHALHLDRDGYQRWSSAVRIITTERNRVTASLER
jgi:hypothetical protein